MRAAAGSGFARRSEWYARAPQRCSAEMYGAVRQFDQLHLAVT